MRIAMRQQRNSTSSSKRGSSFREERGSKAPAARKRTRTEPARSETKAQRPKGEQHTRSRNVEETPQITRLNKAIADAGVASRRRADELIRSGCVRINGMVVTELGTKVEIDDMVTVNGEPITRYKHLTYVVLNKPKDVISTSSDERGEQLSLISSRSSPGCLRLAVSTETRQAYCSSQTMATLQIS